MTAPLAEERLARILDLLARQGTVRTVALTEQLGVSGATARRDLDLLAQRGLIRKVHGGAALASQDQHYQDRQQLEQGARPAWRRRRWSFCLRGRRSTSTPGPPPGRWRGRCGALPP
ncbi:DeoR family transcriptional regulator [Deinococcus radiopugnans]|uniref:DeoR family transcriptional regulator n=1 Tax=Deinococcus radiopugnans TaxID=57497 RepID=UPI00361C3BF2